MKRTRDQLTAVETYWKQAQDFVRLSSDNPREPNWFVVSRETPELIDVWKRYYVHKFGFVPRGLELLEEMKIETFLVPTERPEWFDGTFRFAEAQHAATQS